MRTYEKQYGGRSVRHLVYHWVEESWYREYRVKYAILRVPMFKGYALVKTRLKVTKA